MENPYKLIYNITEIESELLKLDGMFYRLDKEYARTLHANVVLMEAYLAKLSKEAEKEVKRSRD